MGSLSVFPSWTTQFIGSPAFLAMQAQQVALAATSSVVDAAGAAVSAVLPSSGGPGWYSIVQDPNIISIAPLPIAQSFVFSSVPESDPSIAAALTDFISTPPENPVMTFDPSLLPQVQTLQMPREMLTPVMEIPVTMPDGSAANITTPAIEVPSGDGGGGSNNPDNPIWRQNNPGWNTASVAIVTPDGSEINIAAMPTGFSLGKMSKTQKWIFAGVGVVTVLSIGKALTKKRRA